MRTLDHAIEKLGRRRVHRLDAPVRAALRLGAYQLGFVDGVARYAAVNESVELVRRARLERAVPFTNAVLRRLADGLGPFLDALPEARAAEAGLKHSYPDWIAETWWRDLGPAGALDLMRSLNEPGRTVVRLVSGEIEGTPDPDVPGAWRVDRITVEALDEGRVWPQSAASQLVGPHGRRTSGRAHARPVRGARRQGDDARGRGRQPSRSTKRALASSRRTRAVSARRTFGSSSPTAARCRRSSPASTTRSWMHPAPASVS